MIIKSSCLPKDMSVDVCDSRYVPHGSISCLYIHQY